MRSVLRDRAGNGKSRVLRAAAYAMYGALGAGLFATVAPARAQVEGERRPLAAAEDGPQQKLMSKRAAQMDAYRLMAERIGGLRLSSQTTVANFVTQHDEVRSAVEAILKGVRFSEPRYVGDGTCEIDAEVTMEQVVTLIKRAVDQLPNGNSYDVEGITRQVERKVLTVTGAGAVRAGSEIPEPTPAPAVQQLAAPDAPPQVHLPPIYTRYAPAERLKARRAAQEDAYRLLLERIYGLRLGSQTTVGDFVTQNDQIRSATEGELKGVRFTQTRYDPDGVVEVQAEVTLEQVVTIIKRVYDEVYHGGQWHKEQFDDVRKYTDRKVISVVGTGALDTAGGGRRVDGPVIERRQDGDVIIER